MMCCRVNVFTNYCEWCCDGRGSRFCEHLLACRLAAELFAGRRIARDAELYLIVHRLDAHMRKAARLSGASTAAAWMPLSVDDGVEEFWAASAAAAAVAHPSRHLLMRFVSLKTPCFSSSCTARRRTR